MTRFNRILPVALTIAATAAMLPGTANAAAHHHRRYGRVKGAMLIPAHERPGYHGYPGYAGGGPGTTPPMLIDLGGGTALASGGLLTGGLLGAGAAGPGLLGGGGLLGVGVLPASGLFAGIPVIGSVGL